MANPDSKVREDEALPDRMAQRLPTKTPLEKEDPSGNGGWGQTDRVGPDGIDLKGTGQRRVDPINDPSGSAYGNRTRLSALRGPCPSR